MRAIPLSVALAALVACSSDHASQHDELAEISQHHASDLHQFEAAQAEFARKNPMPQKLEFPGEGTLLLHECTLEGYPGHEELWLRYTYVNTTGHDLDAARITLTLSDPSTRTERNEKTELALPLLFRLTPESSYTTYTHVPLRGVQTHPGWAWKIQAEAVIRNGAQPAGVR